MKERMQRLLSLCAQFMGLLYLIPVVSSQHHLCIRPVSCDHGSVLPDPDDCQAYFECNDRRRWEQQRCSNSQRFDVVQMACIKKNQARCLDCSFTTPSVVDETAACSPPVPCVLDSVLGNPDSCASYQMCFTERNWRVFDCPDGQLFDILSSQCVDSNQEEYICQPSCVFLTPRIDSNDRNNPNPNVASTSPFIRTIEPDILDTACGIVEGESCPIMDHAFPDVNDCEYFYLCTGIWRRLRCAEVPDSNGHDYYDAVSGQCRTIDMERTCAAPCSTTAMPTTTSSPAPTIDPVILERACNVSDRDSCTENAEYLPNPADCGSFFFCLIRTWKKISCTNGQHFDALSDNTCKDPDLAMCAPPCPTEPIPTTTSSPPTSTVTSTATSTTTETSTTMQEITHTQTEELTTTDPQNPTTFAETTTIQSTTQPPITQPSTPPVPTSTTDTSLLTTPTSTIPSTTQPSTPTLPTSTVITTPPIVTPSTVPRITTQPSTPPIPPSPTTPPIVTPSTVPRFTTQPSTPSQPTTRTTVTSSTTTPSTTSTTTQPLTPAETVPTTTTTPPSSTVPPTTIPSTSMESSTTQSPTTTLPSTSTASITTSETTESSTTQSPTTTSPSTSTASITTRETTQPSTTVIYTSEEPTTLETPPTTIPPTSHEPSTSNMVTTMPTDPTSTVPPEVTTSDARSSETPVTSPTTTEQYLFTTTLSGEYCAAVVEAGVTVWPETLVGTVARSEVCRPEQEGYVSRQCVETLSGGAAWADPDFGMCVDRVYQELLHEAEHLVKDSSSHGGFNATAVLILAEELEQLSANATSAPGGMTPGNLNVTVEAISLLGEITEMGSGNGTTTGSIEDDMLEEIVQEVIETVSIIVSPENADGWSELLEMDPNRAVSILSVVDGVALQVAQIAEPGADISFVTNTIVVEVYPMDADETETLVFEGMVSMSADDQPQVDTIAIPMMTLANIAEEMDMDTIVVYGTYYNTLGMYMPTGDLILNSNIMALSVKDLPFGTHLHPPVEMNFTLLNQSIEDATVMCAYWNYTSRTSGYWSSEGCTLKQYSLSRASCQCNHLTNFAVLMSPYRPAAHHVQILSLITIVGCLLSIVGCFATLCLYVIAWKRIASEHAAVMLNLCVVLILANGLFLAGIERTENWIACTSVAALLHYLYLTACMIMLADGIEFVLYVMYVFHVKRRKETVLLLATCYVVPATIVGISLSVTKLRGYGTDEYCWLAKENGLLAAFIGPVVLITLANFIILIKVLQTAAGSKAREHKGKFWSTIWNVTVILPLLGITWVFGVIAINEDTVYFQYVFATLNSLQGFFIFIFHCALNKKLREAVIAKFSSRGSTTSSMRSGKSAKSKKSTTSNLSDKSGKSDKKNFLSRKKKDSDTKGGKGKPKLKGTQQNYVNGDIENAVYSEYITPSRAAAQNGYVQEVSGENDLYCDIIEANMNPKNDLNKGIRWHYDKSPFSTRSDRFVKVDDRKAFERASITSVKSYEKKDVAEEFLIMEPEYIDENREIHFIDNRAFFDDTESDSQYMEIDNLEDSASVNQWTRYQINHSGDESNVQQPQHWIRYQISNNDPNYVNDVNGPPEYMNGIA